jgi:hypothetical protein
MANEENKFRASVENHPIGFAALLVVASGAICFAVMSYFHGAEITNLNQQHTAEVTGLQNQLASINRKLAGGDYFNVAKLMVPRSERSRISPNAKFFSTELFYASTPPGWGYQQMKDIELWNTIYGKEGDKPDTSVTAIAPLHVWKRGPFVHLEGNKIINNIAPLITVQRFPNKELLTELGIDTPGSDLSGKTPEIKRLLNGLHMPTIFQGDIVGAVLAQNFSLVFDQLRFVEGVNVDLVTINKVSNVLYCQILITLRNGSVGNAKFERYYLSLENIVISTKDSLYVICDIVPSDDPAPRGPVAAEVSEWLNDFAILSE